MSVCRECQRIYAEGMKARRDVEAGICIYESQFHRCDIDSEGKPRTLCGAEEEGKPLTIPLTYPDPETAARTLQSKIELGRKDLTMKRIQIILDDIRSRYGDDFADTVERILEPSLRTVRERE